MRITFLLLFAFLISACVGAPEGIKPVENFELQKYLGKWYEIARLDHSFERGLEGVSAEYSLRDDGGVKVINKGFSSEKDAWKEATGKAYFVEGKDKGHLKVSFFGPFYGAYVVFELDHDAYQYAFVSSYNRDYLWLLSRTPRVSDELLNNFIQTSKTLGFDTDSLIFVKHTHAVE